MVCARDELEFDMDRGGVGDVGYQVRGGESGGGVLAILGGIVMGAAGYRGGGRCVGGYLARPLYGRRSRESVGGLLAPCGPRGGIEVFKG